MQPGYSTHVAIDLTAFDLSGFWGDPCTLSFAIVDLYDPLYGTSVVLVDNVSVLSGIAPVPEPATFLLLGIGLAGCAACRWRRARRKLSG
jgi:hypothetical protein